MGVAARQAVRAQLHFLRTVVFKPQHHKAVLGIHRHPDQPLFVVGLGLYALRCVVQRRAHNRADLPCFQKVQQMPVRHAGHCDVVLLAVQAFGRQQSVQHRVAGLVLRLVLADAAFHGRQRHILLGVVPLRPDGRNLHFQLVVAPVDQADVLLALLVLLVLAVQNAVQLRQLAVQGGFTQLLMLHRQNQHPGQVHQRADVKHVHVGFAAVGKAQIAHGKCGQRHDHRHKSSCGRYFQLPGRAGAAVLHKQHGGKNAAVHHRQQQQRKRLRPAALRPQHAVQLPFHAGRQLRQNKGPRAHIARFQQRNAARDPQKQQHGKNRRCHAGDPPLQRDACRRGGLQKRSQQHRPTGFYTPDHALIQPRRQPARIQQRRQHFRQSGVQAGNIRQCRHWPAPPM